MDQTQRVLEYKCPCCNAGLTFREGTQQLKCEYCDSTFDVETVKAFNRRSSEEFTWEKDETRDWSRDEQEAVRAFQCPSCGGEILTDEMTAATFCPFCDNPTIFPSRLSGSVRPDAILPFQKTQGDAEAAFLQLCKGKPLLPKGFTQEQRLERITGMYVPFWLYDCEGTVESSYKATRVHTWMDSRYHYTKTDHYLLHRNAKADFSGIPMDGSSKMEDAFMESIEPFDYSQMKPFDMAYLTGFLADKYDVPSEQGEARIRQRVDVSLQERLQPSLVGYATVLPTTRQLRVAHSKARYVLLPVWILNTNYQGKLYTFAMNGQTGKMTGTLPCCPRRTAAWFGGILGGVTLALTLMRMFLPMVSLLMHGLA